MKLVLDFLSVLFGVGGGGAVRTPTSAARNPFLEYAPRAKEAPKS